MRNNHLLSWILTGLFAALSFIGFMFIKINFTTPFGSAAIHFGNVFCVLAALIVGGKKGGLAGAIGMGIADVLDPLYITSAPKTLILKFIMGIICGFVAHRVLHIEEYSDNTKKSAIYALISCGIALGCNVILDPLFGFVYKVLFFNLPLSGASVLASLDFTLSLINALSGTIVATIIYVALAKRYNYSLFK